MKFRFAFVVGLAFWAFAAVAQFRVEVSGVGLTQLPVAVVAFRGDEASPQKMGAIVQADLERSGQFRLAETIGINLDESVRPDLAAWRQIRSNRFIQVDTGSVR